MVPGLRDQLYFQGMYAAWTEVVVTNNQPTAARKTAGAYRIQGAPSIVGKWTGECARASSPNSLTPGRACSGKHTVQHSSVQGLQKENRQRWEQGMRTLLFRVRQS